MKRLNRGSILSLLACLVAVATSGCMIGPTHSDNIGNIHNKIAPAGFVLDGGSLIEVQAFNWRTQRWDTVATTRSRAGSNSWDGLDWHYWQAPHFQIGYDYWADWWSDSVLSGNNGGSYLAKARLRALSDGAPLYTFKKWNLGTLREMQADLNGFEITIFGDAIRIDG